MNRRNHRRRNGYNNRKTGEFKQKAVSAAIIICISVSAGYLTASRIIAPALGIETSNPLDGILENAGTIMDITEEEAGDEEEEAEEETSGENAEPESDPRDSGFALQYGSFSTREGADECVKDLEAYGIQSEIIEKDGSYKVIGKIFATEDEARNHKENSNYTEDVFITEIK